MGWSSKCGTPSKWPEFYVENTNEGDPNCFEKWEPIWQVNGELVSLKRGLDPETIPQNETECY